MKTLVLGDNVLVAVILSRASCLLCEVFSLSEVNYEVFAN